MSGPSIGVPLRSLVVRSPDAGGLCCDGVSGAWSRSSIEAHGAELDRTSGSGGHYRGPAPRTGRRLAVCGFSCGGGTTKERPRERGRSPVRGSAAQAQTLDQRAVALDVLGPQVVQQASALADEEQQATTAVVVVLVLLQVLGEVLDALGQHRDLHLGRTGVALVRCVLGHDLALDGSLEGHGQVSWFARCAALRGC